MDMAVRQASVCVLPTLSSFISSPIVRCTWGISEASQVQSCSKVAVVGMCASRAATTRAHDLGSAERLV